MSSTGQRFEFPSVDDLVLNIDRELATGANHSRRVHARHAHLHSRRSRGGGREVQAECEAMHSATARLKILLRQAMTKSAAGHSTEARKTLRARAAKGGRRTARIIAAKQLLSGRNPVRQGASVKWPTVRGVKLTSPNMVLGALGQHMSAKYGAEAGGATVPQETLARAASATMAANMGGSGKGDRILGAWGNRSWRSGGQGIRAMEEQMVEDLHQHVNRWLSDASAAASDASSHVSFALKVSCEVDPRAHTSWWPSWWPRRRRSGAAGHRANMAWTKMWAIHSRMCNHTLSARARLHKLRAEILPGLMWGSAVWHLRPETIGTAAGTVVRMARLVLHARRQSEESWVD